MTEHATDDCQGEFTELHRIDPQESAPTLDNGKKGAKKYKEKTIVYYCPECGAKKEEAWT